MMIRPKANQGEHKQPHAIVFELVNDKDEVIAEGTDLTRLRRIGGYLPAALPALVAVEEDPLGGLNRELWEDLIAEMGLAKDLIMDFGDQNEDKTDE